MITSTRYIFFTLTLSPLQTWSRYVRIFLRIQRKKERDLRSGENFKYFGTVDFTVHLNCALLKIVILPTESNDKAPLNDSER